MSSKEITQPLPLVPEVEFTTTPEPLWKRITSKINYTNFESTQQSSNSSVPSPMRMANQIRNNGTDDQPNINQFLLKLHHRISDSVIGSESEVMEKISLDWGEDSRIRPALSNITKSFSINDANSLIQTPRTERIICTQMSALRELMSVDEFLSFIAGINPRIHKKVSSLIDENTRLNQECNTLKYREKKTDVKTKLLHNQVEMLQTKNSKLISDFEKLRKEVDLQIQLEEDKLKYEYEKKIQSLREQFQKRQNSIETSTKCSNSNHFGLMKQSGNNSTAHLQENLVDQESPKQAPQQKEGGGGRRRGQFAKTDKRNGNFRVEVNQEEATKTVSRDQCKKPANWHIEQMMLQIMKPAQKQNRSLKLHALPRQI